MAWQHEVFACYARPSPEPGECDLASWSAKLVATLSEELNRNSFGDVPPVRFSKAMGTDRQTDVQGSALLLVLLSPALLIESERLAEIAWFRDQAARDGRTSDHVVVITVHAASIDTRRYPEIAWAMGGSVPAAASQGFMTADGTPLEADHATPYPPFVALEPAILSLAGEIRSKLEKLSALPPIAAPEPPPKPRPPVLEKPRASTSARSRALIYLESASSEQSWRATKSGLDSLLNVNPAKWPEPPPDLRTRMQRREDRRAFLLECKGQVLIRADASDPIALQVTEAQSARNELLDVGAQAPPWVLVDWVGDAGPYLQDWADLPRVSTSAPDWPDQVKQELGL